MGRIIQPKGKKGSLKWIQRIVNKIDDVLNKSIKNFIGADKKQKIEWLSPKADDDYAEYRDQAFLDLLRIKLSKTKLKDFWPARSLVMLEAIVGQLYLTVFIARLVGLHIAQSMNK